MLFINYLQHSAIFNTGVGEYVFLMINGHLEKDFLILYVDVYQCTYCCLSCEAVMFTALTRLCCIATMDLTLL